MKFDGFIDGTLIDAKGPSYDRPLASGGLGTLAVVSACVSYPEGLATEAGGVRRVVLAAGSRSRIDYALGVEPGEDPVAVKVVSEELRASC